MKPTAEHACYTDGACKPGDDAPGGWGFCIRAPDGSRVEGHGSAVRTQAKIMEYRAVAEALAALPEGARAVVFSDDQTLVDNLSRRLESWRGSGFAGVDPSIVDSVRRASALIVEKGLVVRWQWVRAHNGNPGNERANDLAAAGARAARASLEAGRRRPRR